MRRPGHGYDQAEDISRQR